MKILVFDADQECQNVFSSTLPGAEIIYQTDSVSADFLRAHQDAEAVSVFVSSAMTKENIDALPHLKCIVARSTGVDHIDVAYAKQKNIVVCNVPKYGARTVAEFTFALLLTLSRRVYDALEQVRENGDFSKGDLEGFDLFGKTIGVIGTGSIGRCVVQIAQGFGMKILMTDAYPDHSLEHEFAHYVDMDTLLAQSDIVTLHVPYTAENHHLLNAQRFAKMKRGAYIINTARGELIDTEALVDALRIGVVAGAGLDVLEEERVLKDEVDQVQGIESVQKLKVIVHNHTLIDMPRVIVTPHVAFFSKEAYREILGISAGNLNAVIQGSPKNTV